jgi:hypothetical protein
LKNDSCRYHRLNTPGVNSLIRLHVCIGLPGLRVRR